MRDKRGLTKSVDRRRLKYLIRGVQECSDGFAGILQIPAISWTGTIHVHKIVVSATFSEGESSSHARERHKIQTADHQNDRQRGNRHCESRALAIDQEQAERMHKPGAR